MILLICIGRVLSQTTKDSTRLVIELTRHGSRAPVFGYSTSTDPWVKEYGKGDITRVGMRQHLLLGKEMAKRFPDIFTGMPLRFDEIYVRSTDYQRTTMSALSHVAGLYDNFLGEPLTFPVGDDRVEPPFISFDTSKVRFDTGLPYGLVPTAVHTEGLNEDRLIYFINKDTCPAGYTAAAEDQKSYYSKVEGNPKLKEAAAEAASRYGIDTKSFKTDMDLCVALGDYASQDILNNPNPKIKPEEDLYKSIERCYIASNLSRFRLPELQRAIIGPLVLEILAKLKQKVEDLTLPLKYQYYSGHDSTLIPLLKAIGGLDADCYLNEMLEFKATSTCKGFPDVASNLVFELVTSDRNEYFVKTYTNFQPVDVCKNGKTEEQYRCSLKDFSERLKNQVDSSYDNYCKPTIDNSLIPVKAPSNPWIKWGVVAAVLFGLSLISLCCLTAALSKRAEVRKSKISEDTYINANEINT